MTIANSNASPSRNADTTTKKRSTTAAVERPVLPLPLPVCRSLIFERSGRWVTGEPGAVVAVGVVVVGTVGVGTTLESVPVCV